MTDSIQEPDINNAIAAWEAQARDLARRSAEVAPANKAAVFDVLTRAGITRVIVQFDGYGDSGQIESIDAFAGDAPVELPSDMVELLEPVWESSIVERSPHSLHDAIETLAYDFLKETHDGWENSDGAYGDFSFDVESRTITLAYNERHMESDYSQHVF